MEMLFSPTKIQGLVLKNRLMALPVFTGYSLPDGRISLLMLEHYRRLASSGVAVVVVPNVAVTENGRTTERSLRLDHDTQIEELRRLVRVIKENGAIACVQLNHAGRYAISDHPLLPSALDVNEATGNIAALKDFMESFPFVKRFGLTAHVAKMAAGWTLQMTDTDIQQTINMFGQSAFRAFQAGFEMIELHGATGYLITQFLSARTNRRKSPWGGSPEARMRFPLKIIDEIKSRLPDSVPVGFRLILDEKTANGISLQEAIEFAQKLEQHGAAYLSATIGTYQSMFIPDVAKQLSKHGYLTSLTKPLCEHVNLPVIISGRIVSPKLAEKILYNKEADLIGLGRPLLADPEWLHKAERNERIIRCNNCNTCFKNVALGESVICDRWPKVVQDRIKLETRFTSRNSYRTLIVLSSISDLEIGREQILQRVPVHKAIFDRYLFLNTGEEEGFTDAAIEYAKWCDQYLRTHLERNKIEYFFLDYCQDPVDVVMEHLKENFGFVCISHDEKSEWKKHLVLKVPADVVVFRGGTHPNIKKVLIPCDLTTITLMQIRVALHVFHGRSDVDFRFAHITKSPNGAKANWARIREQFEMDPSISLKTIQPNKESSVAGTLLDEAKKGEYGSMIIGRRSGLARVRRSILGSVSARLLKELPECSFAIVG
jgi:2,4-dienoyl-CoA reductase-like NADH-dependent reductase (Old Yellow Enzyme family)